RIESSTRRAYDDADCEGSGWQDPRRCCGRVANRPIRCISARKPGGLRRLSDLDAPTLCRGDRRPTRACCHMRQQEDRSYWCRRASTVGVHTDRQGCTAGGPSTGASLSTRSTTSVVAAERYHPWQGVSGTGSPEGQKARLRAGLCCTKGANAQTPLSSM